MSQGYDRVPTSSNETEPRRESEVDSCLCLALILVAIFIFLTFAGYLYSPSQATIDLRYDNMQIQLANYCANRCCYSRYTNTYSRQYGIYSSSKVFRVEAVSGCVQCPDQRHFDYYYDCNTVSSGSL